MPPPYRKHVFVCLHQRPADNPKGSCGQKGSADLRLELKKEIDRRGLKAEIRINEAGCLDACEHGVSMVVYPDNVWYAKVTAADLSEIVEEHLVGGRPVERLRMPLKR